MTTALERLIDVIDDRLVTNRRVVVGISGFGGAGKTHLANTLRGHFGLDEGQVVRGDSLYSNNPTGPASSISPTGRCSPGSYKVFALRRA